MRFMLKSPVIRGKTEIYRASGRRPPAGKNRPPCVEQAVFDEGRFAGAEEAGARTGGVAADDHIGQRRRTVVVEAATDAGAVAAEDDVVQCQGTAVVEYAAAAMSPTAGDCQPFQRQRSAPDVKNPAPAVAADC
jgi:hypothetical protein